jgi:trimethylamine monooxygenase
MYHNSWTNILKEFSEIVDYSFDKHFGQPITSVLPRSVMADYIRGYGNQNNIRQYIRFNTIVRWISYSDERKKFNILVKDLCKDESRSEEFDYIIVATGHFSTPNVPNFHGIETFPGRILHSHDFRSVGDFVDQNVLIIGNGASANDIALQLYKYNAKSITISYRTQPKGFKSPEKIKEIPLLVKIERENVYFVDGSSQQIDAIIFCTGYLYYFPFLDDNLRLTTTKHCLYPPNLYKAIFWLNEPHLLYLGMQYLTFGLNINNIQAFYARDYILGKISLPLTKDEMQSDITRWQAKEKTVRNYSDYIDFFKEYIQDLLVATDYPRFDIDRMGQLAVQSVQLRFENMLTYRDKTYPSTLTNTMGTQHHTPWLNEMDDRLENFVKK